MHAHCGPLPRCTPQTRGHVTRRIRDNGLRAPVNIFLTLLLALLSVALGDATGARARLDPHWPAIEEQIAAKNSSMTKGLRVLARLLRAEGKPSEARATIERAVGDRHRVEVGQLLRSDGKSSWPRPISRLRARTSASSSWCII